MKIALHWFRRDLRVSDNTALSEAARRAELIVPVFILEDAFRTGPDVGAARLTFLLQSLEVLRKNLRALGYPFVIRHGRSEVELLKLCRELGAEAVFCNKRYEPYGQARDSRIFNTLNAAGIGFEVFKDAVIWEERDVLTKAGNPFTVFTPYSKAWKAKLPTAAPRPKLMAARKPFPKIASDPLPADSAELGHPLTHKLLQAPGEEAAQKSFLRFIVKNVFGYAEQRNFPAVDGTSQLSTHLRCGNIGIRSIFKTLNELRPGSTPAQHKSLDTFASELIWREFYLQVLSNFPHVMRGNFRPEYDGLEWSDNREHFQAWCAGMTGYPIVDAAMRCLNATGWMHNRLRMIVAMFLTKDLLIHWQWGERYFMQKLVDGDMAANNGGWQWSAGTGTDAAPYFRIFNPVSQGERFDPAGAFVRQWLPELSALPNSVIHQPWEDGETLRGTKYPARIVLHAEQRAKCLAMFKKVKSHA